MATKDNVTEEELKWIDAMRHLETKPEGVESPEDFERFIRYYPDRNSMNFNRPQIPKISTFFGESGKGEVNYTTWRYEVRCLMEGGLYPDELIGLAIRKSVKGEAAAIVTHLGVNPSTAEMLKKFESNYGEIDSKEVVLKKFYACAQQPKETVHKYAARIEEIFAEAIEIQALRSSDEEMLRRVFYQGLQQPLKQSAIYYYNTEEDYDQLKIEVRKLEQELALTNKETTTQCKATTETKSEIGELKDLLKQMNTRIEQLEKQQQPTGYAPRGQHQYRGPRHARGSFGRGTQNNGRGQFRPTRPTGSGTFRPQQTYNNNKDFRCYHCNKTGHIARNCRQLQQQLQQAEGQELICYKCNNPGHIARNCQEN
jgi:hypothetical protein